jgi:hypothetical protein
MQTRRTWSWQVGALVFLVLVPWIVGQAAGDPAIVTAARTGDGAAVRALIARRADVSQPASDGSTALLWAVYSSNLELTRALLALKAVRSARKEAEVVTVRVDPLEMF